MLRKLSISLYILLLISYLFQAVSVTGQANDSKSLHPVHPSYPPRRQLAQIDPVLDISLYYAEVSYQESTHYAATIHWHMRYPTVVASDIPGFRSIRCDVDGIHVDFASPNFKNQTEAWRFPLVIVLDGNTGGCVPDESIQERYHPFYVENELQNMVSQPTTRSFAGFRSRWDIVAYDHEVQVTQMSQGKSEAPQNHVDRRRGLQTPLTWQISPSLNFDRQNNTCSNGKIPINLAAWEQGSVSMVCRNCFIDTNFQLSIYSGSRIINAGIKLTTKILRSLYRAEQTLLQLSRSAKKIVLSQFSILSERLADAIAAFFNRINDLALSADPEESIRIKQEMSEAASFAGKISLQLLDNVKSQLDMSIISTQISSRDQFLLIEEIKEIASSTSNELEQLIGSGVQLAMNELSLPVCTNSQEVNLTLGGACRRQQKETFARLTGRFKVNADIEITLTGTGARSPGDITVLSINLAGIQIPGVLSIGPQARLISNTGLVFTSSATVAFGGDAEWQQIDAMIYGKKHELHQLNGTNVVFHQHPPQFQVSPQQLSLEQHFKPQVTFGIDLLLGAQQLVVGIGADIGLINTFQLPKIFSKRKEYCSDGINYDFNVTAQLEGITSIPTGVTFLLSQLFPRFSNATNQTSYPLVSAPSLNLIQHCFKVPESFWSDFDRTSNKVLPSSHMRNFSSSEFQQIHT